MRSAASMHNSVSIDATTAMVAPTIQTLELESAVKSGVTIMLVNSANDVGTGRLTKWSFNTVRLLLDWIKSSFRTMLMITAISAGGTNFIFFRTSTLFHRIRMASDKAQIKTDPK